MLLGEVFAQLHAAWVGHVHGRGDGSKEWTLEFSVFSLCVCFLFLFSLSFFFVFSSMVLFLSTFLSIFFYPFLDGFNPRNFLSSLATYRVACRS